MCSRFRSRIAIAALLAGLIGPGLVDGRVLRVCADPNNLPFSNQAGQGFENRIAELMARNLGATLEYTWWSERKGFIKNSLEAHRCDVIIGVPTELASVLATAPYYRSTYVFASRADRKLNLTSLSDPRMAEWRIGVHIVGDDYAPPAQALARRGLSANLVGYSLFGAYGEPDPPSKIVRAVANGDIDVAIVWGPFAGYFAKQQDVPLDIVPVSPEMFMATPFTYSISLGVRKEDRELKTELDRALEIECPAIEALLGKYGIPQVSEGRSTCAAGQPSASLSSR